MNDSTVSKKFFLISFGKVLRIVCAISVSLFNMSSKYATAVLIIIDGLHASACAFIFAISIAFVKSPNA